MVTNRTKQVEEQLRSTQERLERAEALLEDWMRAAKDGTVKSKPLISLTEQFLRH